MALRYSWAYAYSPSFVPIRSVDEFSAAEASGKLQAINPGAADPFQIWTTTVLIGRSFRHRDEAAVKSAVPQRTRIRPYHARLGLYRSFTAVGESQAVTPTKEVPMVAGSTRSPRRPCSREC